MLIENLESRRLMAAQVVHDTGSGILTIQGDNANDFAVVVQNMDTGRVEVQIGENDTVLFTTEVPGVTGIFIDLADGDNGAYLTTVTLPALVLTGSGMDWIEIVNDNTENSVGVSSGGGSDMIWVLDGGAYGTTVWAGEGDDGITVTRASSSPAFPTLAYGENGADYLQGPGAVDQEIGFYDPGVGYCDLDGGDGDDIFVAFNGHTPISGGSGYDIAVIYLESDEVVEVSGVEDLDIVIV